MLRHLRAVAVIVPLAISLAAAAQFPYALKVVTFYQMGVPADWIAGPAAKPDTSFARFVNTGPTTLVGTFMLRGTDGTGTYWEVSVNQVLFPGQTLGSISLTPESSNRGGFNKILYSADRGIEIRFDGVATDGYSNDSLSLSVFDADVHSGVARTNPFGEVVDSYVLQGGDPFGRDTGDPFEISQTPGEFTWSNINTDSDGDGIPNSIDQCPTQPGSAACNGCPTNACGGCGPAPDQDGDGKPDCQDNCPAVANPSQADCDGDGQGDACEGAPDCNGNGRPDGCDIASGSSNDVDGNGIPDSCQPDCNLNGLPDAWEISTGRVPDMNADGKPDTCQGAVLVRSSSGNLGSPSGLAVRAHDFTGLRFAETPVTLTVDAVGDLNNPSEWIDVAGNGTDLGRLFATTGTLCPTTPDRGTITLTRAQFNALLSPDGSLRITLACPPQVDGTECKGAGLVEVTIAYVGIDPRTGDCNGNRRLDIVETYEGSEADCNSNQVPDSCDIARGVGADCNANGVIDACEVASNPSIDCNGNGIIDSCDIATGGAAVDCDGNGRLDSCQVLENPAQDCNANGKPDSCDIAGGTSADIDANARPDECQTVTVPGNFGTIQAAIDAAPANEMRIISVAAGTYAERIAFNGKPVRVRGAGAGQTIINAAGLGGGPLSVVRFTGGEPAIAALERVTVRGGASGSPIPTNQTVLVGGGLFGLDSAASVRDCVFENNSAGFGGGAYFLRCSGAVTNSVFRGNAASTDGGGFQSNQGTQRLTDVVIQGNSANSRGGGLHLVQGQPTLTRVQVIENQSSNLMGGLSWFSPGDASARLTLVGCTVTGNQAAVSFGGVGITESTPPPSVATVTMSGSTVCENLPRPNVGGRYQNLGGNTVCDCPADISSDGVVNGGDLGLVLSAWGPCSGACPADLNSDGVVNGLDLGLLLSAWGPCG